jgi:predicted small secreted protein
MKTRLPLNRFQFRVALLVLAAALCIIATTACNTMHGFGRDVERTGEKIERASKR